MADVGGGRGNLWKPNGEDMATVDEVRALLTRRHARFGEKAIQDATQFRCESGEIVNVYHTGRVVVAGNHSTELAREVAELTGASRAAAAAPAPAAARAVRPPVFIVYGHDVTSRDQLELLLRRMGLEPIILQNLPAAGDTIIEKLERYLGERGNVGFACVLLTPDDEGHLAGQPEQRKYRARQNVILELGMVLARLGRRRVAILHKESVELPSDIAGLIYVPYKERVGEVAAKLFQELREGGYEPNAEAL